MMTQYETIHTDKKINVPKALGMSPAQFSKLTAGEKIRLMRTVYKNSSQ
jgi:hypothetical protein